MKRIMLLLIAAIIICPVFIACNASGNVSKPTVGSIPDEWYLSDQDSYGTFVEDDNTKWGLIEYTDEIDADFVQIYWGDIPPELEDKETDGDALIGRAILESGSFMPTETGTMTAAGKFAGYTKACDAEYDICEMEIVFIIGSTCIDIYTMFDDNDADEAQVMSLIDSIR